MKVKKMQDFIPTDVEQVFEAQSWPKGSIAKVMYGSNLGVNDGGRHGGWSSYRPDQHPKAKDGWFYMRVEHSGRKWMEGPMLYSNCLDKTDYGKVRADKDSLVTPGPEFKILESNGDEIKKILNKSFFLDGNEKGIIDMEGKATTIKEGEYFTKSVNFTLTASMKEPVFFVKGKGRSSESFCATMDSINSFSQELNQNQREVIAEWFAKELGGAIIHVHNEQFRVDVWYVNASQGDGYPSAFSAGPFVTKKQADEINEAISKLNKYSLFSPDKVKLESETGWSGLKFSLDDLIEWCKTVGVKTTMKELLNLRKGAVIGKDFGL